MPKYVRKKEDGFVYDWNHMLAQRADMEVFESDETPMPERIPDLPTYLAARTGDSQPAPRRGRPPKADPKPDDNPDEPTS